MNVNEPNAQGEVCFLEHLPRNLAQLRKYEEWGADLSLRDFRGENLLDALALHAFDLDEGDLIAMLTYLIREKKINTTDEKGRCFWRYISDHHILEKLVQENLIPDVALTKPDRS